MFRKLAILGASRGLGAAISKFAATHFLELEEILIVSRKIENLEKVRDQIRLGNNSELRRPFEGEVEVCQTDFSRLDEGQKVLRLFEEKKYDLVVYCAGGGPHGEFQIKEWKDHQWSLNVNLVTPMAMVHQWLLIRRGEEQNGRFVIVGSRIAEQSPDPLATSYAAGKHGIYGFVSSIQPELEKSPNKVWLFSPGFMDTDLLPSTAKVRHDGSKLMSVDTAAQGMLRWLKKDGPWHRVLN